jgi:hypothetical protein
MTTIAITSAASVGAVRIIGGGDTHAVDELIEESKWDRAFESQPFLALVKQARLRVAAGQTEPLDIDRL